MRITCNFVKVSKVKMELFESYSHINFTKKFKFLKSDNFCIYEILYSKTFFRQITCKTTSFCRSYS